MWDEQSELAALQEIYNLTAGDEAKKNWRKLLVFGNTLDQQLKRKLLWIWPTASDLTKFHQKLDHLGLQTVLSIGCGSGLLEWLISAVGGEKLRICGLERDPNWWRSKYAVRSFIPLNYIENAETIDSRSSLNASFLSDCCSGLMPSALLFCYFNNRRAFLDYLNVFEGIWIILIGPEPGFGIHTDPNPLQPELSNNWWALHALIDWTEHNVVAIYKKLE
ncbi:uncharacterized protein LOC117791858 [Drosophila innubila]|uniref:uncharacterized protein LOC117791858 n=1 Tax=Drosophila innubila TaxID=198719 RepID=UPI00148D4639|nr:uncharacterized protein LOC117791858 [Drosophila innubila]